MRVILDFTEPDQLPTRLDVKLMMSALPPGTTLGVNDAGHGNVLLDRIRKSGMRCERWFRASCGLRKKED